ncbi:transcription termination/antitermination protein NusA [Candidatus Saccharibacteria bacterium]|nr:transcription termination/antitermination protein NusA [Candidatus Saccharibacteria bacterium]
MEGLDLKQMSAMVKVIAEEKNLPEEIVLDVIQMAIAAAWRKDNGDKDMNVRAVLNVNTGEAEVFVGRTVVEDEVAYNPSTEIPQKEAGKGKNIGDLVEEKHKVSSFGRVAAQTAKQVVIQRLREAERDAVLAMFEDKIGTVMTGMVARVERNIVRIDLGRATGIMPRSEQIDGEYYTVGSRIKVYIKGVERDERGAQLILSRGCSEFIEYLFRQEVPEIENGTVEIRGIAREAGRRTKIAVMSTVPGIDPVGTFVGGRGVRVQAVMNEIGDREKIDIVTWSDNAPEFIREALSPAEVVKVEIKDKTAKVFVTEDQQSIAIGRQGQNVRLASKLTGFELDIELAKAPEKKKKKNVEDSLLSAIEESEA